MTRGSFWRPPDWINPHIRTHTSGEKDPRKCPCCFCTRYRAYEAGADAMGEHILSLLKDKAPSSSIIDILEGKR